MNAFSILCLGACLVAAVYGSSSSNSLSNNMQPREWLSASDLEQLPAVDQLNLQQLESMSLDEGADLVNKLYHLSQINQELQPAYVPTPNEIPAFIAKPNGQRVKFNLQQLAAQAKQQEKFGDEEVTIFITGLPHSESQTVKKANRNLVQAYMQRYNGQQQQQRSWPNKDYDYTNMARSESDEDYTQAKSGSTQTGNLVVIELGDVLTNFKRFALLDVEKTGAMIGRMLVQLTNEADVPEEIIHIVGQGIGAHVAGVAGRTYTRLTGHQLRRITALDPSRIFARTPNTLTGLTRGDADFVDAIHTSAYGMGTPARVGNADFYPNGPSVGVPGAQNIVEASMRATRYYAESVRPGNEENFPAVAASSLQQYKNNDGYGPRAYMGINTDFDVEGDYILQVNSKSPFGRRAPAQTQKNYHSAHQSWKSQQA